MPMPHVGVSAFPTWNGEGIMRRATFTLLALLGLSFASVASADNYNEGIDGDLSNNRLAPTVISLDPGSNTITATSVAGDPEYYTVNVPSGFQLSPVTLVSYVSLDSVAFVGLQSGTTFTEPATGTDVTQLLGWLHFGPGLVGTDILDDIGLGPGAIGFTGPLPAGDYTFWSQQTGANATTYTFDLVLTAAPSVPALSSRLTLLLCAGLGLVLLMALRRREAYETANGGRRRA
jgi:hypothetical protein